MNTEMKNTFASWAWFVYTTDCDIASLAWQGDILKISSIKFDKIDAAKQEVNKTEKFGYKREMRNQKKKNISDIFFSDFLFLFCKFKIYYILNLVLMSWRVPMCLVTHWVEQW